MGLRFYIVKILTLSLLVNVGITFCEASPAAIDSQMKELVLEEWESFKVTHGKTYENEAEENFRLKIYLENRHFIAEYNHQHVNDTFQLGMNKYGDLLSHEFSSFMNGWKLPKESEIVADKLTTYIPPPENIQVPDSFDWRSQGAVTPIKDQGQCGSCWAFSATGALEGQHFRKTQKLVSLSEQNLLDCADVTHYGCHGCEGGSQVGAYFYIRDNDGIDTEASYPYEQVKDTCRYNPSNKGAEDVGAAKLTEGDENMLKNAVATLGPISVAIDASQRTFQAYKSGVYYDSSCSSSILDHGVLVVGYGTENGNDYWLVKNSWGTSWGESGYIKMSRNKNNACGIATYATYPLV